MRVEGAQAVPILGITPGSSLAVAAALFCASVCFVGLIFLLGSVGGSQQAVAGAGWACPGVFPGVCGTPGEVQRGAKNSLCVKLPWASSPCMDGSR